MIVFRAAERRPRNSGGGAASLRLPLPSWRAKSWIEPRSRRGEPSFGHCWTALRRTPSRSEEMRNLAGQYVQAGTFTAVNHGDALHVAAAVLTQQDVLLSWNFKHLVNRRRRAQINQDNISLGLPTIEIVAPPEI